MTNKVQELQELMEAMRKIKENKEWVETLRQCGGVKEKLDKLMKLLPGTWLWDPMSARQLVYYLQKTYGLDFGVCDFYIIKGDRQYCTVDGTEIECLCAIPQPHCVFRDKEGPPKYPEFSFIRALESLE